MKKVGIFAIVGAVLLLGATVAVISFNGLLGKVDYAAAKEQAVKLMEKHAHEMQKAADALMDAPTDEQIKIAGFSEIYSDDTPKTVYFRIDAQGMLGGQYWGIFYSPDDAPRSAQLTDAEWENGPNADTWYFYDERGNNFFAVERLSSGWFFYYDDYDNNRHGLDWMPAE